MGFKPITRETIDSLMKWYPPDDAQKERHAQVRTAFEPLQGLIRDFAKRETPIEDYAAAFDTVNLHIIPAGYALADHCPQGPDLAAAVRSLRLCRNALNEFLVQQRRHGHLRADELGYEARMLDIAWAHCHAACWQGNGGIALEGKL